MSNHFLQSFVLILFFWAACNANEEFLRCMTQNSEANIDTYVYAPNSPKYSPILKNAQKNGRWMNTTSANPLFIVAPFNEAEVPHAIFCSQKFGLQIRVKSGGHDYEGLSFRCETPFIMIDLCNLKSIEIDLEEENAWIQTGVTLGELYHAISEKSKNHAFPGGLYPSVGSGGHISGGGIGTLVRKYGLAADNVIDARIVDADGRILDREEMGDDLFWAIRGGGGSSFGVILAWRVKLVRVPEEVTAFAVRRRLNPGSIKLLQKWENISHQLPANLFLRVLIQNAKHKNATGHEKFVQLTFHGLFLGTAHKLMPLMNKSFPEFELETKDCFGGHIPAKNCVEKPCVKKECFRVPWIRSVLYFAGKSTSHNLDYLVSTNTSKQPSYYKAKSDFVKIPIPDEGWEMVQKMFLHEDSPMMILDPFGGKMTQISESEIPFPHRYGNLYNVQYLVYWENNEDGKINKHVEWIRKLYKNMEPFVSHSPRAAYINYKDLDLGSNVGGFNYLRAKTWGERYFKGNFARLAAVKSRVDPSNFFRNEQSIPLLYRL